MIIFKFSTPEKVRNYQTVSNNFFKCVFTTLLESTPKKIFETNRTTSRNFFEGVFMNYFQILHPEKCLK